MSDLANRACYILTTELDSSSMLWNSQLLLLLLSFTFLLLDFQTELLPQPDTCDEKSDVDEFELNHLQCDMPSNGIPIASPKDSFATDKLVYML